MNILNNKILMTMSRKEFDTLPFLYEIALKDIERGLRDADNESNRQMLIEKKKIIDQMKKNTQEQDII